MLRACAAEHHGFVTGLLSGAFYFPSNLFMRGSEQQVIFWALCDAVNGHTRGHRDELSVLHLRQHPLCSLFSFCLALSDHD